MKIYLRLMLALAVAISTAPAVAAQDMGMNTAAPAAAIAKLFGDTSAFSATADMTTTGKESHSMSMKYFMRDGMIRMDLDMAQLGGQMPQQALDSMKRMGMQHYTVIVHTGVDPRSVMLFPDLKAYVNVQPREGDDGGTPKIEKSKIGTETIDGHLCNKYHVNITQGNGKRSSLTEWQATDLKNFPIQFEMADGDSTNRIRFKDIVLSKPSASLFEVPTAFTGYDNMRSLMMSNMGKLMGGMLGHP